MFSGGLFKGGLLYDAGSEALTIYDPQLSGADVIMENGNVEFRGNVGIGTSSPKSLLEVSKNTDNAEIRVTGQANVADKGAILSLMESDPLDYGFKIWLEGVQNQLHFEGFAGGLSKGKHLTINRDNGNVGIGASNPTRKLHVAGEAHFDVGSNAKLTFGTSPRATVAASIEGTAANGRASLIEFTSSGLSLRGSPSTGGIEIDGSGRVGIMTTPTNYLTIGVGRGPGIADGWVTHSSRRWKENIKRISGALAKVQRLRGVTYDWKTNGKHDIGLIAEEVGEVVPEVVEYEENGRDARSVDYARLVAVLIEAVKKQQKEIEKQQAMIDTLQERVTGLEENYRLTSRR